MGGTGKWYFTKGEIETETPSRRDGISRMKESELRRSYCLFQREFGTKLKVGRVTISTAMMLCHQFYMRQSHGKNDWKIVATSSMLLACKLVDEVRFLNDIVFVGYEIGEKFESSQKSSSGGSIRQREFFRKQRDLILLGERLVMQTIGFEFDRIKLPFDPLTSALKRLNCSSSGDLGMLTKSLIEECLQTTLCLEFKPHCIAAGSVAVAAEILKVPIPSTGVPQMNGKVWWHEFEVSPQQLREVVRRMQGMLTRKADGKQALCRPPLPKSNNRNNKVIQHEISSRNPSASCSSSQSCVSIEATVDSHPTKKQRTSL